MKSKKKNNPKKIVTALIIIVVTAFICTIVISAYTILTGQTKNETSEALKNTDENTEKSPAGDFAVNYGDADVSDAGEYAVGSDFDAGEYILIAGSGMDRPGYFGVYSASDKSMENCIMSFSFDTFMYVEFSESQFITLSDCVAVPSADIELSDLSGDNYSEGMYKVGKDIAAGTYTLSPNYDPVYQLARYHIADSCMWTADNMILHTLIMENVEITLSDGQYIYIDDGYIKGE